MRVQWPKCGQLGYGRFNSGFLTSGSFIFVALLLTKTGLASGLVGSD